jgi:exosome complex component CSL4
VKRVVVPGEFLNTAEEFAPASNVYEHAGSIYANSVGTVSEDKREHVVSVRKAKPVELLKEGTIVYGTVTQVRDKLVMLSLKEAWNGNQPRVIHKSKAVLQISEVSRRYIKNLADEFKIGDIVKAKVSQITPYVVYVRTNEPTLGVVKAYCSRCRKALHLIGGKMRCLHCGAVETRKYSTDYVLKV